MEEEYDETQLTKKIYGDRSEQLQGWIEALWYRYGIDMVPQYRPWLTHSSYCETVRNDPQPLETLRLAPISVIDTFFNWVLSFRSDTLRCASSLQTYWNAFTLVRKKRTGVAVDPTLKSQMEGVRWLDAKCRAAPC